MRSLPNTRVQVNCLSILDGHCSHFGSRMKRRKLADTNFIVSSRFKAHTIGYWPFASRPILMLCVLLDFRHQPSEAKPIFVFPIRQEKERPTLARLPIACAVVSCRSEWALTAEVASSIDSCHSDTYWDPDSGRLCAHSDRNRRSSDSCSRCIDQ